MQRTTNQVGHCATSPLAARKQELLVGQAACGGKQDPVHEHSCFFACLAGREKDAGRMVVEERMNISWRARNRAAPGTQVMPNRTYARCCVATNASVPGELRLSGRPGGPAVSHLAISCADVVQQDEYRPLGPRTAQ